MDAELDRTDDARDLGRGGGVSRQGGVVQGLPPTHESGTASVLRGAVAWHDATEAVIVGQLRRGETPTAAEWRAHHLVEQALFYLEAAVTADEWAEAMG